MKKFCLNHSKMILLCAIALMSPVAFFGQSNEDGPNPPPEETPINDYIYPMMIVAFITILFFVYKKQYKSIKTL